MLAITSILTGLADLGMAAFESGHPTVLSVLSVIFTLFDAWEHHREGEDL